MSAIAGRALRLGILLLVLFTASRADAQQANVAADQQYNVAAGLHVRKAYDLAAAEWAKFIQDFPREKRVAEARHFLGVCRLQLKDYPAAIAAFDELIRADSKYEQINLSRLYLGTAQFHLGQDNKPQLFAAAEKTLADLLRIAPEGKHVPQTLYYLGESQYAQGKRAEAVDQYRRFVSDHPNDASAPEAWYALGVALGELNRGDEAEAAYQEFLKRFPEHPYKIDVDVRRAELLAAKGSLDQAERLFAAAAAAPGNAEADYALLRQAGCVYERKQYAEAAALYDDLPRRFPRSDYRAAAALGAGRSLYYAGDYPGTIARLDPLVKQGDELGAEAAHFSGRAMLKQGGSKEATAALFIFEAALKASPKAKFTPQLALDAADALYRIDGRRADALAAYQNTATNYAADAVAPQAQYLAASTALELNRNDEALQLAAAFQQRHRGHALEIEILYVAAEAQLRLQQYDAAADSYARLLGSNADHADRPKWLVQRLWALMLAKKYDAAVKSAGDIDGLADAGLQSEARHVVGVCRQAQADHAGAIAEFRTAIRLKPDRRGTDATYLALAESQQAMKDEAAARATLTTFAAEFPQSEAIDRAQYRLGELAYNAGDLAAAEAAYRRVAANANSEVAPQARYGLAWSLLSRGAFDDAAKELDALIQSRPSAELSAKAHYARALAEQQLKRFDDAIDDLNEFLKSKPQGKDLADALFVLGVCQEGLGRSDDALATFGRLLKSEPNYSDAPKVLYEIGWIHKLAGRNRESAATFAQLAKAYPTDKLTAEALYHVGEEAYARQDYGTAIDAYYDAREKADTAELGEKAAHKLAWTCFHRKNYDDALIWFRYQQKTYAGGALAQDAAFMEAETLFKQENFAEALAAYGRVKNSTIERAAELTALHAGQSAAVLKDWKTAEQLLDAGVKQFPESALLPEFNYERGWVKQNLGKEDEALQLYESVTKQSTGDIAARARFMIGELWFIRKNHAEAIRHFFMAAYNYQSPEWQAKAHVEAGRCFEVLGKPEQAKQSYEEVVKNFPQSKDVELARNRLAELNK